MPTATHVLVVAATADADQLAPHGAPNRWSATVCDDSPFAGLFAHGDDLHDARAALANAVWLAAKNDPAIDTDHIDAVRILTVTRKTFSTGTLDAAVPFDDPSVRCHVCGSLLTSSADAHTCPTQAEP